MIVEFYGGLGNQMFQWAFLRKLQIDYKDIKVQADLQKYNKNSSHNGFEIDNIFNLEIERCTEYESKKYGHQKLILPRISRKILKRIFSINSKYVITESKYNRKRISHESYFRGFWQSQMYFEDIQDIIRSDFKFPSLVGRKNNEIYKLINETNSVSIHVRRGDYLKSNNNIFKNLTITNYYSNAIEFIKENIENPVFFVFSDDIDWCKNYFKNENAYFIDWNTGKYSYIDMQLMSLCKNNIIANSTFSWWGAWLNSNIDKLVISPSDMGNAFDTDYFIPQEWIKIKND